MQDRLELMERYPGLFRKMMKVHPQLEAADHV
jgi:hypothetical protein